MRNARIKVYVGLICLLGLAVQALVDWGSVASLSTADFIGLAALTVLGLLSESLALTIRFGGSAGHSSITFLPLLACALVFGPAPAVLFIAVTGGLAEFVIRKKEFIRATFNLGQYVLSTSLAGIVFSLVGGVPQTFMAAQTGQFHLQLVPFILFGVTFLCANHAFVSGAVAIHQGLSIGTVLVRMVGSSGTNILYDLLVSPIAVAVAFLYIELRVTGLLVVLLPLFFIRHSYLTNYRLQRANRDLLKALVKAIETRDPYTSGHSMRVAWLAKAIAERLGLPGKRVEAVETAALLHDIGKIDAVFNGILRKEGKLTSEERAIIQSHVTRGVELLKNLASYPVDILEAVQYHHERIDGRGYPEGLRAESIPLAARIINTCDAIDAMLSDRPYRKALEISRVHAELVENSGTQFDPEIVRCIVESDLLIEHQAKVQSVQLEQPGGFVVEQVARESGGRWFRPAPPALTRRSSATHATP